MPKRIRSSAVLLILLSQAFCRDASGPGSEPQPLRIAAVTFRGTAQVIDETGAPTATISCGASCSLYHPQWSRSGTQLAMIGYDENRNSLLYVSDETGSTLREIARTASIAQPSIKGSIRYLPNYYDQTWSRSGVLAYVKRDTIFQLSSRSDAAPVRVLTGFEARRLSWVPGDTAISFLSDGTLRVVSLNGDSRQVGSFAGRVDSYDWAPDGSAVVVTAYAPDSFRLFKLNIKSGSTSILATHSSISPPCWSENSKSITYVGRNYGDSKARLFVADATEMSARVIGEQLSGLGFPPIWMGDNKSLLVLSGAGLAIVDASQDLATTIPTPSGLNGYAVSTSHCGKMFYLLPDM